MSVNLDCLSLLILYFQINQEILNDTDIISVLLDVISSKEQLPEVISASYHFIQAVSMHNAGIQNRLFHEIDKLLHCKSGHACHDWENAMADAVGEIFHDNKDISAHIKAHHIKIMVDHLAARGTKITAIMHALRYVHIISDAIKC